MAAAVTSSYAFMLPVATAPNAIVFGASTMTTGHMMKAGFGMNIITVITTLIAINTYAIPLYGLDAFPEWAVHQLPVNVTCAWTPPLGQFKDKKSTTMLSKKYEISSSILIIKGKSSLKKCMNNYSGQVWYI